MKNSGYSRLLIVVSIGLLVVLGCTGGGSSLVKTERRGCVTPDGSKIGIAKESTVTLIDAESGKIRRTEKTEEYGGAICLGNNDVIAVYPKLAVELTGDARVERSEKTLTIVGPAGSDGMVHYEGGKLSSPKAHFTSPLGVYYEKLGVVTKNPQTLVLPPETFRGLRPKKQNYFMIPVRVLNDGNLLVAAGSRPGFLGDSEKLTVDPDPWGFFLANTQTGEVRNFGATKIQDAEFNFIYLPKTYATPDGSFVAVTSFIGRSYHVVAVWSESGNKQLFKRSIGNATEVRDVIVSDDGSRVAILVRIPDGYKIEAYDTKANSLINAFDVSQIDLSSAEFLSLSNNELILSDYHTTVAKTHVDSARIIWVTNAGSK